MPHYHHKKLQQITALAGEQFYLVTFIILAEIWKAGCLMIFRYKKRAEALLKYSFLLIISLRQLLHVETECH